MESAFGVSISQIQSYEAIDLDRPITGITSNESDHPQCDKFSFDPMPAVLFGDVTTINLNDIEARDSVRKRTT